MYGRGIDIDMDIDLDYYMKLSDYLCIRSLGCYFGEINTRITFSLANKQFSMAVPTNNLFLTHHNEPFENDK